MQDARALGRILYFFFLFKCNFGKIITCFEDLHQPTLYAYIDLLFASYLITD